MLHPLCLINSQRWITQSERDVIHRKIQALINLLHLSRSQVVLGKCSKHETEILYINVMKFYSKPFSHSLSIVVFVIMKNSALCCDKIIVTCSGI